jgi:hypothetical protein
MLSPERGRRIAFRPRAIGTRPIAAAVLGRRSEVGERREDAILLGLAWGFIGR